MKILTSFILGLVLISSCLHATVLEDIINQQVSVIIEKGAQKNIIPLGAYYISVVSHFEELNKNNKTEYQVSAVIKNLNNRTKISFSGLFDEDLNLTSYLYNYSFFNGAKDLSSNMGFHWLDYANSPNSTYCPSQNFSENSYNWYITPAMRQTSVMAPMSNVNTSSNFQDFESYGLLETQGNYPPPSDVWFAPTLNDMGATFFNNYYVLTYVFYCNSNNRGGDYWAFKFDVLYQPCSGQKTTIYTQFGSNIDDWHDDL